MSDDRRVLLFAVHVKQKTKKKYQPSAFYYYCVHTPIHPSASTPLVGYNTLCPVQAWHLSPCPLSRCRCAGATEKSLIRCDAALA